MSLDQKTIIEFQVRRAKTWEATRFWRFLMGVGFIGIVIFASIYFGNNINDQSSWQFILYAIFSAVLFLSSGAVILIVNKYYRCPVCEEIPLIDRDGIDADPVICPMCKAKLK